MIEQTVAGAKAALATFVNPEKRAFFPTFFKSGPGQYGEGDEFLGVTVPNVRIVAKQFAGLTEAEIYELMNSSIHEHRLMGLIMLVAKWNKTQRKTGASAQSANAQQELFDFYLRLVYEGRVNNWDLVDTSAPYFGMFLIGKPDAMELLESLAPMGYSLATDVAEWLVKQGVPFRDAHEITGELVKFCEQHNLQLEEPTDSQLASISSHLTPAVREVIDIRRAIAARDGAGGTSLTQVDKQLETLSTLLAGEK